MAKDESKPGSVPQPQPLKEGEILPGVRKDKDYEAERAPAPEPEPLKEGEAMPGEKSEIRGDWPGKGPSK